MRVSKVFCMRLRRIKKKNVLFSIKFESIYDIVIKIDKINSLNLIFIYYYITKSFCTNIRIFLLFVQNFILYIWFILLNDNL